MNYPSIFQVKVLLQGRKYGLLWLRYATYMYSNMRWLGVAQSISFLMACNQKILDHFRWLSLVLAKMFFLECSTSAICEFETKKDMFCSPIPVWLCQFFYECCSHYSLFHSNSSMHFSHFYDIALSYSTASLGDLPSFHDRHQLLQLLVLVYGLLKIRRMITHKLKSPKWISLSYKVLRQSGYCFQWLGHPLNYL